jgi:hypothetical protein
LKDQITLVSRVNKELQELENDITALIEWHDNNHKDISGIKWQELDEAQLLVQKIKKYIKK